VDYLAKVRSGCDSIEDDSTTAPSAVEDGNEDDTANDRRRPLLPLNHAKQGATVGTILSTLALTGQHRVFITDNDLRPVGVVSVSDVLNFALGLAPPQEPLGSSTGTSSFPNDL